MLKLGEYTGKSWHSVGPFRGLEPQGPFWVSSLQAPVDNCSHVWTSNKIWGSGIHSESDYASQNIIFKKVSGCRNQGGGVN